MIVFDFETGGVRPEQPSIQLAAVAVDDAWNEIGSFERKIQFDEADCDPEALKINHYSADSWRNATKSLDAFAEFSAWMNKYKTVEMVSKRTGRPYSVARLAAYNASFDKDRLWAMSGGAFVPAHPQVLCVMQLAAWSVVRGIIKPASLKLSEVAAALGISSDGAHDALSDVRISVRVARALCAAEVASS